MDMPLQFRVNEVSGTSGMLLDNHDETYNPDSDLCYEMLHGERLKRELDMRRHPMITLATTECDYYASDSDTSAASNNARPRHDINFWGGYSACSTENDKQHTQEPNDTMDAALGLVKLGHGHSPSEDCTVLALVQMRKVRLQQSQNQVSGVTDNFQKMHIGQVGDVVDLQVLVGSDTNGYSYGDAEQKSDSVCTVQDGLPNEEIILQLSQSMYSMRIAAQRQF